ncbi:nucleoside hydrolase-like domain-containing protein [Tunicatimonas pelagia]|uniref:nucleoside hydrolase-like domain-containing protein n=1 Tax=Tunicatimonas pelagia TaxID=931531 RepID=UPI002665F6A5|nr:nucleoside hydrolase-like domain-containing protein [Tunicatimonas pelagia]WKN42160.1 DUF1593 domain-containing protein [Tunicatimonas pelagia]
MRKITRYNLIAFLVIFGGLMTKASAQPTRLIVTTDIGQDPDDQQSLVRLLHYANEFDIVGIIANADANNDYELPIIKDSIIHQLIDDYAKIEDNLRLHNKSYPSATHLHSVVKKGCAGNSVSAPVLSYIGQGKDTEGSDWILEKVLENNGPTAISVWGGGADLAQALWKARATLPEEKLATFVERMVVYFINKQDSSCDWIIEEFPKLTVILGFSTSGDKWASAYRGMFLGGDLSLTSRAWLNEHILGKNPLANQYPTEAYTGGKSRNPNNALKEGDTPAWLYFLRNGLNHPTYPSWGGWGGRYQETRSGFYTDAEDTYLDRVTEEAKTLPIVTVFRWRPAFQHDFAARVQWATTNYENANHPPIPVIEGQSDDYILQKTIAAGEVTHLDATSSYDPDGDGLSYQWYFYEEAGTVENPSSFIQGATSEPVITLRIPQANLSSKTAHLLLELTDNGSPSLVGYRRVVLTIE